MCVSTPSWGKLPLGRGPTLRVWWMPSSMGMWELILRAGWWGRSAFFAIHWYPHYYKVSLGAWGFTGKRWKVLTEVHLLSLHVEFGLDWSGRE